MNSKLIKYREEVKSLFGIIKKELSIDSKAMKSSTRKKEVNVARRIFYNILYDNIKEGGERILSQSCVSSMLNRDMTTFIHHRRLHLNHINKYKDYTDQYNKIEELFKIEKNKIEQKCLIEKKQA
jgi:flagellar capping protein FliD